MLFTNFLKSKENFPKPTNQIPQPKPQDSLVIKPLVSGYISNRLSNEPDTHILTEHEAEKVQVVVGNDSRIKTGISKGSTIAETMAKIRESTPTKQHLESTPCSQSRAVGQDDPNPLHRLSNRRSHARQRSISRSKMALSKVSSADNNSLECSSFVLEEQPKLCINCENYIPACSISWHEQSCPGFEHLFKMTKQQLFMFVHDKILRDQIALNKLADSSKKGVVLIGEQDLRGQLERRIVCLHKVRNGIMTKLC